MQQSRKKLSPAARPKELDKLFAEEVRHRQETARQQAVQSILSRRELLSRFTVAEYLDRLKKDARDMWEVVSGMDLVAFADTISNARGLEEENRRLRAELQTIRSGELLNGAIPAKRSRLSNVQKDGLKRAVVDLLAEHPQGLTRAQLAEQVPDPRLRELRVPRIRLSTKLRIPLAELQKERRLQTLGEKRFMRYLLSPAAEDRAAE